MFVFQAFFSALDEEFSSRTETQGLQNIGQRIIYSVLVHAALWIPPPSCLHIENASCNKSSSLATLLCLPYTMTPMKYSNNIIVKNSLKIWTHFFAAFGLYNVPLLSPHSNPLFYPSTVLMPHGETLGLVTFTSMVFLPLLISSISSLISPKAIFPSDIYKLKILCTKKKKKIVFFFFYKCTSSFGSGHHTGRGSLC